MPTLIINYSELLRAFVLPLLVGFTQPQMRHALNVVQALVVCPFKHKVLTVLTGMLRVRHADVYALADFLRVSPWDGTGLVQRTREEVMRQVLQVYTRCGGAVFVSVDDSLLVKSVTAEALEAVSFHHDHARERAQHSHYSNAAKVLVVSVRVGAFCFVYDFRLYLKRRQVRRLNYRRTRAGGREPRLTYRSLPDLTADMLGDLQSRLRPVRRVYVLADGWFSSAHLFDRIHHQWHWDFIMASKGNRHLGRYSLNQWWKHLGHQPIRRVPIDSTKGRRVFQTRCVVHRLPRFDDTVKAVLSKEGRRRQPFVYLLCSNPALTPNTILQYYAHRWDIEVAFAFLKGRLGWGDFRVQSVEATQRWLALVFTTYAFVISRAAQVWLDHPDQPPRSPSDVVLEQQTEQLRFLVTEVARRARTGQSDDTICGWLGLT